MSFLKMTSSRNNSYTTTTSSTSSSSRNSSSYNSSFAGYSATSVPEFVKILNKLPKENNLFADTSYYNNGKTLYYQPGIYEIIAHLKLIKSFQALKRNIVSHANPNGDPAYLWNAFVHNSIRRFITFIGALKHQCHASSLGISQNEDASYFASTPKNSSLSHALNNILPPIDILFVWYSLLINSERFYDIFARYNFLEFVFHPFPLCLINASIKNDDFSYLPNQFYKNSFYELMAQFNCNLNYDLLEVFNPEEIKLFIKCPNCEKILHNHVPLCNFNSKSGFIDKNFKIELKSKDCGCGFDSTLTHDNLRIRQLYHDLSVANDATVPNVYRIASKFFTKNAHTSSVAELNDALKKLSFDKSESDLSKVIEQLKTAVKDDAVAKPYAEYLDEYFTMDLMHLTIPKNGLIQLSTNVTSLVSSKFQFIKKINTFDVLHSENLETTLNTSINRYLNFWSLMKNSTGDKKKGNFQDMTQLVPTIDIDMIWHTHKLFFHYYYKWSLYRLNQFVDRNEMMHRQLSDKFFENTAILYKQSFHDDFTNCPCKLCSTIKAKLNHKLTKKILFGSSHHKDTNDYVVSHRNTNVGLTHISRPNSVASDSTEKIVEKVKHYYYDDINKAKLRQSKYIRHNYHSLSNISINNNLNVTGYCI